MKFVVHIALKDSILDPQGEAITNSLRSLGFDSINSIRQGKSIEIDLEEENYQRGRDIINKMCDKLLVNDVIETFFIESN